MKSLLIQIIVFLFLFILSSNKEIKNIKYEEDDTIGILTIISPDNSIIIEMDILDEMENILNKIDTNKIRVLIITDNPLTNNEIKFDYNEKENKLDKDILTKLDKFEIPIIFSINNYALGIMFELFLTSDIRICSEKAMLGYPLFEESQRLSSLIGQGMSKQIMFTKQIINAKEALRIRLVNNIYPQNELMDRAKELSKMISKNGNNAIKKAKKAINEGNRNVANDKNIYKLKCACQNYDWGKYANDSLVATALRKNGETVDDKKRYAEYWMGTHPNGPSKIIKNNKEILLSDDINGQLSYLFKILSIEKPLSIQLHPDKTFAEILNKKFPKIYKDDNHKPELFIALSDFELLFGFVEVNKAVEVIKKYKNCFNLKEGEKLIANPNIENYKEFIERLIYLEKDDYEKILKLILESDRFVNITIYESSS